MFDAINPETRVTQNTNKITAQGVQVYYGAAQAIKDVSVDILDKT
ncbi:MAG TPA: phosphate ABC transporter ATP-binding protein, partial [Rhodobacteraceae bacterium]|nr:phosphate ABC transporter ATP-binding protein [Paracoccaceae bacterium]